MQKPKPLPVSRFSIRYWPTHILFALATCFAYLPYPAIVRCGKALGWLMYKVVKQRATIARINIQLCFPDLSTQQQEKIVKENFLSMGIGILETAMFWFGPQRDWASMTEFEGLEYIQAAKQQGKGALLLSFHLTSLEIGGGLLGAKMPVAGLYRRSENPVIERAMVNGRNRFVEQVPRESTREAVRKIKNNELIWYAADQDYGRQHSVFVPFFGIPAATLTATTRFVKLTGAPVIPMTQERLANNRVRIVFYPPLPNMGEDVTAGANAVNRFLEAYITEHPADYLWVHRRFKTRPHKTDSPIYPAKFKSRLTPERFKNLIEGADWIEHDDGRVKKLKSGHCIVHLVYGCRASKWGRKRQLRKTAEALGREVDRGDTYIFQGAISRCESADCDLIYLEKATAQAA